MSILDGDKVHEETVISHIDVKPQVHFKDVQFSHLSKEKQAELKFFVDMVGYVALKHANEKKGVKLYDARFENLQDQVQQLVFIRLRRKYEQYMIDKMNRAYVVYIKQILDEYRALDGGMKVELLKEYKNLIDEAWDDKGWYPELGYKRTWDDGRYEELRDIFHESCQQSHIPDGIVLFDEIKPTDCAKTTCNKRHSPPEIELFDLIKPADWAKKLTDLGLKLQEALLQKKKKSLNKKNFGIDLDLISKKIELTLHIKWV